MNRQGIYKLMVLFTFLKRYWATLTIGIIALIFGSIISLAFPFLAGKLVDMADGKTDAIFSNINVIVYILFAAIVLQSIFLFIRSYAFAYVSEKCLADLRHALYEKILWLPLTFFNRSRIGELMSRITSDVGTLQDTFTFTIAELLRQTLILLIGIIVIFMLTPKLTIFMLLTFPVLVLTAMYFGMRIRRHSKVAQDLFANSTVIVEETFQVINVVKSFSNEAFESQRYKNSLSSAVRGSLQSSKYRSFFTALTALILTGGIMIVSWYGTTLVQQGQLTSGELFSFVLYTGFIGGSIAGLGELYGQVQRSVGASERIHEILEAKDEKLVKSFSGGLSGKISFENVNFSYPERNRVNILDDLSFAINEGEKVAFVGSSGSGKSTIINLLLRLYQPEHGRISIGGINVLEYGLSAYRSNIGLVPQEVILFGGTIRENIEYGRLGATHAEIVDAAAKANALDFIESFPDKFDTVVGDRGVKLSGGQRQRIAIARVILRDPSILILDEATSSLDVTSEKLVQDALERLMVNRTTIVIAHRLSTIRTVDRIFVVKDGQIAEAGSHDDLKIIHNGIYSNFLQNSIDS